MRQSQSFIYTQKETPKTADSISAGLLLRAGYIDRLSSGIYSFLPLGWKVHQKIGQIIKEEMDKIGGQEVHLPVLQPKELWERTGRWNKMDPPLFKLKDRHEKELALGSTHEEVITEIVHKRVKSFKDLPLLLYQIQTKFRNEQRATGGLLRTREFVMKDAYSFHVSEEDRNSLYQKVLQAYHNIFQRCGLKAIAVEAATGSIGGSSSHEFMVLSENGEDRVAICEKGEWAQNLEIAEGKSQCPAGHQVSVENAIELGHIFNLGCIYSEKLQAKFVNQKGKEELITMGCYGIGLGRLLAAVAEVSHDKSGLIWPREISPYQVHLISLGKKAEVKKTAEQIYKTLKDRDIDILYDEREISPGEKLVESDLLGISLKIIVSEKTVEKDSVEVKERSQLGVKLIKQNQLVDALKNLVYN